MNETLQQFCQRILPVVRAGAEGKCIESRAKPFESWVCADDNVAVFSKVCEYRISKPKATPLPITPEMWAMIDPKYKWAVLVKGACEKTNVVFTAEKPERNAQMWDFSDVITLCFSPLAIDTTGIVPELSMTERPRIVSYADCIDGGCDVHGTDVHVNNSGEVKGGYFDPDLTRKELDRLSDEHLAKVALDGWIHGVKTALMDVTRKPLPKLKLRFVKQSRIPDIYADFLREVGATQDNHADATHYAESITGDHVDLYKKMPDKWMIWDYDLKLWQPVQIFGAEPNPIK